MLSRYLPQLPLAHFKIILYRYFMAKPKLKRRFNADQLTVVNQAVEISEDTVNDEYNLTISTWKTYRYEIKTLGDLKPPEIISNDFAQVVRCGRPAVAGDVRQGDFYRVCLQDHNILAAQSREPDLSLLPLLSYVITHELLHIVRFYRFDQHFDADQKHRAKEELLVHQKTFEILKDVNIPDMPIILSFYQTHRGEKA